MSELHLPKKRRIDQAKLVEYLLHPEKGQGKADLFYNYGFTLLGWELLYEALLVHAETRGVIEMFASAYGTKYIVSGGLGTPDGRNPQPIIQAVWIQDEGQEGVRFVTAYPGRS
jgi:hypothetical protein